MIKIYIVTHNNAIDLNNNLTSLFNSDIAKLDHEVTIINNHSSFKIETEFTNKVKILHNVVRPDFSTGHLSRNWNQALINGFGSLKNPLSDIVVCSQDDVIFSQNWLTFLLESHDNHSFITAGLGDSFCSYTPEAVRKIGLWDERFCNIGYQEGDYFLRALIYNRDKSSINDLAHKRELNPISGNFFNGLVGPKPRGGNENLVTIPCRNLSRQGDHAKSMGLAHNISENIFKSKWSNFPSCYWSQRAIDNPPARSICRNYIYYPYFELDVENLRGKNYEIP